MLEDSKLNDREAAGAKLWVDKYAPRHYTHLLSDDVSNECSCGMSCIFGEYGIYCMCLKIA